MSSSLYTGPKSDEGFELAEPSVKRIPVEKRIERYIEAAAHASESHNSKLAEYLRMASPLLTVLAKIWIIVWPLYKKLLLWAYWFYNNAPKTVIKMTFGICLCFFGGTYVASLAAIEAFRSIGWPTTYSNLVTVWENLKEINTASEKDDLVDDDHDGTADVDQIEASALAQRKLTLALKTVKEPKLLQGALGGLWTAYLSVLATLKLQFAQTVAFALGLVEMIKFPIIRIAAPAMAAALGPELHHWCETIIDVTINIVAVIFAWYLQMIISAFYSAIRGGKMFAIGLIDLLAEKELLQKFPCYKDEPFDPDSSYVDEVIGYMIAAVGFWFQITSGFSLPLPFNLIFLPLTIIEWFLRWQITMTGNTTYG